MKLNSASTTGYPNRTIPKISKRVLVVDEDGDLSSFCALTLARTGYTVDTAANDEQAWEALYANDYDLLLTNNAMPHMTGVELVARLRRAGMKLPVIIVSDSIELPVGTDGEWLEFTAVLHKPFTTDELMGAVQHVVPLQRVGTAFNHHLKAPTSEIMSVNQPRCEGLNE